MPQPTTNQVHVNRPLTNIAVAYLQQARNFIATRVFPVVPSAKESDLYFEFNKNDWLRDEAKPRAPGAESAGTGYNISQQRFDTVVESIHHDVPDQLRNNADVPLDLDRQATQLVTHRQLIRRERRWAQDFFTAGVWATDFTPANLWDDFILSTPRQDIENGIAQVLRETGYSPNKLVLGYNVFSTLKSHPDIRDQYKYVNSDSITPEMLAQMFELDEVVVSRSPYATNIEGGTEAYEFIAGNNALLVYAAPSPAIMMPTGGYVFAWTGMFPELAADIAIKSFRIEHRAVTRVEGEMAYDMRLVGPDLGYFFPSVIS